MSEEELKERIARNIAANEMIDTETGLKTVKKIAETADAESTEWALIGGIAMHLYGSGRLTRDVDLIASRTISLPAVRPLSFGGERYTVKVEDRNVAVDWIVRRDNARRFYEIALSEAVLLPNGIKVVTPEWLIILKFIAGRYKDQEDGVFLLRQTDLVNRRQIRRNILKVVGEETWTLMAAGFRRWFDLADNKSVPDGDENESYRPLDFSDYSEYNE
jgi:hypothetical protein